MCHWQWLFIHLCLSECFNHLSNTIFRYMSTHFYHSTCSPSSWIYPLNYLSGFVQKIEVVFLYDQLLDPALTRGRQMNTVTWQACPEIEREREMFYLTMHSTHYIYGYMASDIWLRTILIVRKGTRCRHIGYSYRLTARVLLYAPSHRQDNTYHGLCYTSRGALAGTRNSSMGPAHEGSIRRPITPWANALPLSYVPLPSWNKTTLSTILGVARWHLPDAHSVQEERDVAPW